MSHPTALQAPKHYRGSLGGRECMWIEGSDLGYFLTSQRTLGAPGWQGPPHLLWALVCPPPDTGPNAGRRHRSGMDIGLVLECQLKTISDR